MSMKTYRALKAFPHGNSSIDKGAYLSLTDKQATFLVNGGFVEESDPMHGAATIKDEAPADVAPTAPTEPAAETTSKKGAK